MADELRRFPKGWTHAYWEILEQVYWVPPYIGLKSIPRKLWKSDSERVSVPADKTSDNGPLYYRQRKIGEYWPYIQRQEETFNHLVDLMTAVLAPRDLAHLLEPLCNLPPGVELEPLGRSVNNHLNWNEQGNYTQPDLFLQGENALVMIEIKFNAKTSLDQFGKYIALAVRDAGLYGRRPVLRLTYVMASDDPLGLLEKQLGMKATELEDLNPVVMADHIKNAKMRAYIHEHKEEAAATLKSMVVSAVSWGNVHNQLEHLAQEAPDDAGGRTYARLLYGLSEAIRLHPLSGVPSD